MLSLHPDALEDLRKSGITDDNIERCGIASVRPESIKKLGAKYRQVAHAVEFPYFDLSGDRRDYVRLKLFWSADTGNGNGKRAKYWQPPNSPPMLYLPPISPWALIATDAEISLTITEGEKKAIAGCQAGMHCIAVGGVWNWRRKLDDGERIVLQDFDVFAWRGRTVELVPDSDAWREMKELDILAGFYALAMDLTERGALCQFVRLPEVPA